MSLARQLAAATVDGLSLPALGAVARACERLSSWTKADTDAEQRATIARIMVNHLTHCAFTVPAASVRAIRGKVAHLPSGFAWAITETIREIMDCPAAEREAARDTLVRLLTTPPPSEASP